MRLMTNNNVRNSRDENATTLLNVFGLFSLL